MYILIVLVLEIIMPAVTVDNILALDRVARPADGSKVRSVMTITTAPSGFEGEGFPVRRGFAGIPQQYLDPFIMLDQMGENEWRAGEAKGTPWHPHRGFETVTYMIEGEFMHRDSEGGGGVISDGDTQWMTAGAGILHIEVPTEEIVISGGAVHGTQLWVNLPRDKKWAKPRYQDISRTNLSLLSSHDGGALVRVIAGSLDGHDGPGVTYSPITYVHATINPGSQLELPWNPEYNALAYVLAGKGTVGPNKNAIHLGQAAVLGEGDSIVMTADEEQDSKAPDLEILILGGQPIREPVAWYGPFVMNTQEELQQAFADYHAGKLGVIPPDVIPHSL
jgi:redox-sensitive bicupin YhaK (pirin superfamily)|tara:strand:+ start:1439 stop:2443 length:1005 start_codon:yes stop_codon:yes gene_type:complete